MKKAIKLVLTVFLCALLAACQNTDFINLSSFIERYNEACTESEKIDFGSFSVETGDEDEIMTFFPFETDSLAVRLVCDALNHQISETRIVLRKTDKSANAIPVGDSDFHFFLEAGRLTAYAFSNGEIGKLPDEILPESAAALNGDNEKTASVGSYYFIYYSNQLVSEIIIKNKWLSPVETTKKPENKEPFSNMTETRSNTVPHK